MIQPTQGDMWAVDMIASVIDKLCTNPSACLLIFIGVLPWKHAQLDDGRYSHMIDVLTEHR